MIDGDDAKKERCCAIKWQMFVDGSSTSVSSLWQSAVGARGGSALGGLRRVIVYTTLA